jgi:hypothetical protein
MKISFALFTYLARQLASGNIVNTLLWANEYVGSSPEAVYALIQTAKKTETFENLPESLRSKLLTGALKGELLDI